MLSKSSVLGCCSAAWGWHTVCHLICASEFVPVPSSLALSSVAPRLRRGGGSSCPAACAPWARRDTGLQLRGNEALLVWKQDSPHPAPGCQKRLSWSVLPCGSTSLEKLGEEPCRAQEDTSEGKAAASPLLARSFLWSESRFQATHLQPSR